jgi:hypothetical protein
MNTARFQMDEKERIKGYQPAHSPNLFGEKIHGPGHIQTGLDEPFPGHALSPGRRRQPIFDQNIAHRA